MTMWTILSRSTLTGCSAHGSTCRMGSPRAIDGGPEEIELRGPAVAESRDPYFIGVEYGSNNTVEVSATCE
eukprot:1225887-Lingulodinium_polyedra.AAC.1